MIVSEKTVAEKTRIAEANLKTCDECGFLWSRYYYHPKTDELYQRFYCPECQRARREA